MIKVQIIHETKNDNWMGLIEGESDIIQILEDGMVDAQQIVAISQLYENTQLYMRGGHIILIEENFCTGNIIKYLWRCEDKNGLEDLYKAKWYLDKLIAEKEKQSKKNATL
jgi:hypothetical protein